MRTYMGFNSVAGIPIEHNDVNEDWEILLNIYATAYDASNDIMLTNVPGQYDPTTVQEIRGRFLVLRKLAKKYAPELHDEIAEIEKMTIKNIRGQLSDKEFLKRLRKILLRNNVPPELIKDVEMRIDLAEQNARFDFKGIDFKAPSIIPPVKQPKAKRVKNKNPFEMKVPEIKLFDEPKPTKRKSNEPMFNFGFNFFEDKSNRKVKATKQSNNLLDINFDFGFDFFGEPKPKKRTNSKRRR